MSHRDDVRFDLELKIDEEIDRQLDSEIGPLELRTRGEYNVGEVVSFRFVSDDSGIPRGMFDERCHMRGFARGAEAVWIRGPNHERAAKDTDKIDRVKQDEIVQKRFVVEAERILRQANVLAEES